MAARFGLFAAPLLVLSLTCGGGGGTTSTEAPPSPIPPSDFSTPLGRAKGVAQDLLSRAVTDGAGTRWSISLDGRNSAQLPDLYEGTAGILLFLADLYRQAPTPALRSALERGGAWLRTHPSSYGMGLYEGNAGLGWCYLTLASALGDPAWLDAARQVGDQVRLDPGDGVGDLISGLPGHGLFLLRLHQATGEPRWLDAARAKGDAILAGAVAEAGGWKWKAPGLPGDYYYVGMAHGSAGAGFFLSRLSTALGSSGNTYLEGAKGAARWLLAVQGSLGGDLDWYNRQPDRLDSFQVQWCHGAPGIGLFFIELHRSSGDPALLELAKRCAKTAEDLTATAVGWDCRCHGYAGNADLFLKLYRVTGDTAWLDKARGFGERVWARRLPTALPGWIAGDGTNTNNPSFMTGSSGVGQFFLELADPDHVVPPITD